MLKINAEIANIYSKAFIEQKKYPLFQNLVLSNQSKQDHTGELKEVCEYNNIKIEISCNPKIFEDYELEVQTLSSQQNKSIKLDEPNINMEYFDNLKEKEDVEIKITASIGDKILDVYNKTITTHPVNYWGGYLEMPELLPAFISKNSGYVNSIIDKVLSLLDDEIEIGYKGNERKNPYLIAALIWNVIQAEDLKHTNKIVDYSNEGQEILFPNQIRQNQAANSLDIALLFTACLEKINLNSIIAITNKHICVGVWLINDHFPSIIIEESIEIRKRVNGFDLTLFEVSGLIKNNNSSFLQAIDDANKLIHWESEEEFVYAIDISQSRILKIESIFVSSENTNSQLIETNLIPELPTPPTFPKVRYEEQAHEETPENRVEKWKRKLLDLTKRNKLLNYPKKTVGLHIFCPDIPELEDNLASDQKYGFIPAGESKDEENVFKLNSDEQIDFAKRYLAQKKIVVQENASKLEKNLLTLFRKAKNEFEEGGSNTLFLSMGMLRWKEIPDSKKTFDAPLILYPVELVRSSARASIKIKSFTNEEPIFNPTLIEFLKKDYDIDISQFSNDLPTDEHGVDVYQIWQVVREKIKDVKGFEVVEEIILSTFSFAKYLMWKDLSDRLDHLKVNKFINQLIETPKLKYSQKYNSYKPEEIDKKLHPKDIYTPLNADSTQIVAIEASTKEQDYILEGPPGTGKSETIANIIAHNIAQGKKVLFLAEKMVALNVVYSRLDKVGLGHLCLELHSRKANKKDFIEQLKKTYNYSSFEEVNWISDANSLKKVRDEINSYIAELHNNKNIFGISPWKAISETTKTSKKYDNLINWDDIETCPIKSIKDLDKLFSLADKIAKVYNIINNIDLSVIKIISNTEWSNSWQAKYIKSINKLSKNIKEYIGSLENYISSGNINEFNIVKMDNISLLIQAVITTKGAYSVFMNNKGKELLLKIDELIKCKELSKKLSKELKISDNQEAIIDLPVKDWSDKYIKYSKQNVIIRTINKLLLKKTIKSNKLLFTVNQKNLNKLLKLQKNNNNINDIISELKKIKNIKAWNLSIENLKTQYENASIINKLFLQTKAQNLSEIKFDNNEHNEEFIEKLDSYIKAKEEFIDLGGKYSQKIKSHPEFISLLNKLVEYKSNIRDIITWIRVLQEANKYHINELLILLQNKKIDSNEFELILKDAFYSWLAPQLIDKSPILRKFNQSIHEQKIKGFCSQDEHVQNIVSKEIIRKYEEDLSRKQFINEGKQSILFREINKKKRHIPIRKLLEVEAENILNLTPCMMMSPISVAQYLPSDFRGFDLVIFDEASQITEEDAVGAIARGKNVIIVGDPKQMPPTNFFGRTNNSDDDYEEEDCESILDKALAMQLPNERLTCHYRSKHETLIAFSNSRYYDNSLTTFPSAETKVTAVSFNLIENGLYSKSGKNNPNEARAVAQEVLRRLKDPILCKCSIGIVTLNINQQRTIEDELENIRRSNFELEEYFIGKDGYDPIFVKNLESVQGDERDVIILSLARGPIVPGAKTMSMHFGPLNRDGGERRLNVAITRAKHEVLVFSSFTSSMIDLSRTQAQAVKDLKDYLDFAERGPIALAQQTQASGIDQFDSEFEEDVANRLRKKGWKVISQVGVSKFRIDLGIVHPKEPGRYLAAVECDGATYHSLPSARDRDRIRQIVLESLGWKFIRIWSTDYFLNPEGIIEDVDNKLNEILNNENKY